MTGDGFRLASIAPRLALARDQRQVEMRLERAARRQARHELGRAEWCVAHRELQLARAQNTRNVRYMKRRERKLADARQRLARAQRRATEAGA